WAPTRSSSGPGAAGGSCTGCRLSRSLSGWLIRRSAPAGLGRGPTRARRSRPSSGLSFLAFDRVVAPASLEPRESALGLCLHLSCEGRGAGAVERAPARVVDERAVQPDHCARGRLGFDVQGGDALFGREKVRQGGGVAVEDLLLASAQGGTLVDHAGHRDELVLGVRLDSAQ